MYKFIIAKIFFVLFFSEYLMASNKVFFEDAKFYFEKKDYEMSKFLFQKSLVFNPKDHSSYLYLAKIFKEENNINETEKNLNTTLLLNPRNEEALFMLIEIHLERSNFSEAKELNEKFLKVCSELCQKKNIIFEKIKNLEPKANLEKN